MHPRLTDWCRQHQMNEIQVTPMMARPDRGRAVLYLPNPLPDPERESFSALVSELTEMACVVEAYPWPSDPVQRLRALWRADGASFDSLLDDGAAAMVADDIRVDFPSAMVESLFHRWGGETRLRKLWPSAPGLIISRQAPADSIPDAPVYVADLSETSDRPRVGKGAPKAPALALNAVPESGAVTVEGRIFEINVRDGRDKLRHVSMGISDGVSAVRLRADQRRGQEDFFADRFQTGQWIRASGTMEIDKYTEESIVRIRDAGTIDAPPALTDGDGELHRVELHLHTKMSAMDGLIDVAEAFKLAESLGHAALAVVDHGVAQAYPEAENWAARTGVRALYGIEVNMVDDLQVPLTGPNGTQPWPETPLVVVDVETTGLTPQSHEVIEIGAVRVEHGAIVDRFHRMVRPTRSVSAASYEITGIRPDELTEAPTAEEVWPDFFAFCEGAALAAHNARFDVGFLSAAYARIQSEPWPYPVLDSLVLARIALPEASSHALGSLTKSLGVTLSQHHRALADAEATAGVIAVLRDRLGPKAEDEGWMRQAQPVPYQVGRPTPVVILVRSALGIEPLYRLISASHLNSFYRVPRVTRSALAASREHWLVASPAHGGEIQEAFYRGAGPEELERIGQWYDYWEVSPMDADHDLLRDEHFGSLEAAQKWQAEIIALGSTSGKPVVAVSDAHYLRPSEKILRDILAETAKADVHHRSANLYYRTTAEMIAGFEWLGQALAQSVVIEQPLALVDRIEEMSPIPKGLFAPAMPDAERVVSSLPIEEAHQLYGDPLPTIVAERLDKEIGSIVRNGFSVSYYIAHLLVKKSLADGYLVGSRGSVGSSLVATLLHITEVNPLPPHYRCAQCRYSRFITDGSVGSGFDLDEEACPACGQPMVGDGQDIAFETFLGFEGDKVPDIDLNFSGEYQAEIHRYTEELFGTGHVFRAGTISTVATKTAFGLVKGWARDTGRDLRGAEVDWLAAGLTGVKRTTGQHPGGVMVVPQDQDIHRFCPVQRPANDSSSDVVTTHFDYHAIEGRLVKLDLLGHDDPTAIRLLEELTGVGPNQIPFKDPETLSLFSGVEALGVKAEMVGTTVGSVGIPEFGTSFVRAMLAETHPSSFADLIRISGISHGTEVWTNNAQDIIRSHQATLSEVIATRDDIMLYLIQRGLEPKTAFQISESVRRGRGLSSDYEQFMRSHGVPDWYIGACHKISYLFPKAHAAAYVMMGWRIAWFKVHYPLAYYATYFSVRASDFPDEVALTDLKGVIQSQRTVEEKGNDATPKERSMVPVFEVLREMLARGHRFLPVDLAKSHASRFLIEDQGLRIPFAALSGLGQSLAENIVLAREAKPFGSIADLRERARVSKPVVELLRRHGALDGLGESSQLTLF